MIKIELNSQEVQDALDRLAKQAGHLRPALEDIGEYLVHSTKQRFATSTAPDGTHWAPNQPSTLVKLLNDRGGLKGKKAASVTAGKKPLIGESKRLGNEIHYNATDHQLEVGSSLAYAAAQQFGMPRGYAGRTRTGSPIPWGDIPARPFLGLSDTDKREMMIILERHLKKALDA